MQAGQVYPAPVRYLNTGNYLGITSGFGSNGTSVGGNSNVNNILLGDNAASSMLGSGNSNIIAIGTDALQSMPENTGLGNIAIGTQALSNVGYSGDNVAIGYQSQNGTADFNQNTSAGNFSLQNNTGNRNTALGYQAGQTNNSGSDNTFIGNKADASSGSLTNATAIGYNTKVSKSNSLILGSSANVGIGTSSPDTTLHVVGKFKYQDGTQANGYILQSDSNGNASWTGSASRIGALRYIGTSYIGITSGTGGTGSTEGQQSTLSNIYLGDSAGFTNTFAQNCIALGNQALFTNDRVNNEIAIGYQALNGTNYQSLSGTGGDVAIGTQALYAGPYVPNNVAIGYQAMKNNTDDGANAAVGYQVLANGVNGSEEAAVGFQALYNTTGNYNTALGFRAGLTNTSGTDNTFVGAGADAATSGLSNATAIGYDAKVSASNAIVLGNGANVGIGTSSPAYPLQITGTGNNLLYLSGSSTTGTWLDLYNSTTGGSQWGLISTGSGNSEGAGELLFKDVTNGTDVLTLGTSGNVGIGTTSPGYPLHIVSSAQQLLYLNGSDGTGTWLALGNSSGYGRVWDLISTGSANGEGPGKLLIRDANNGVRMTFDTLGNVGVGTTSPAYPLQVSGTTSTTNFRMTNGADSGYILQTDAAGNASWVNPATSLFTAGTGLSFSGNTLNSVWTKSGTDLYFSTGFNGNLGIGTSSPVYKLDVQNAAAGTYAYVERISNTDNFAASGGLLIEAGNTASVWNSASEPQFIAFQRPDASQIGAVIQNSASGVTYNTTSDMRLKENIRKTQYGLTDLLKINVSDYNYLGDASATPQTGYLAQQLYTVFPEAVHKGGADAKTDPWMVDYGRVTPLIVKSVQDQQAIIEQQNLKIENLEKEIEELKNLVKK